MKKPSLLASALLISSVALTGCSKSSDSSQMDGTFSTGVHTDGEIEINAQTLKVTDLNGKPIAGAQVLIGTAQNQPFASNFVTTNNSGQFQAPGAWTAPETITIGAPGFVRATFFGQTAKGQSFQLRPAVAAVKKELKGQGTGFQLKDNDNIVDFALMIPAVQKRDLFAFNINTFISPIVDSVSVYGQNMDIPSNVSLPKQKERYGLFPVTIEKPQYRLYFDALGIQRVATVHGQFPFKEVVGEMQANKSFIELINYFTLKGGSFKEVNLTQDSQVMDLPINELTFNQKLKFQSPAFASDEFLVAIALSPYQARFIPTDLKNVPANTAYDLTTAAGESPQLLVVLQKKTANISVGGGKLSAALMPFQAGVRPALLPLIADPQVAGFTSLKMQAPAAPAGMQPLATYLILSTVKKTGTQKAPAEITTPLWDVYAFDWQSEMNLPQWPGEQIPAEPKRWEVSYLGVQGGNNKPVDLSPGILETVTHATHSASDF